MRWLRTADKKILRSAASSASQKELEEGAAPHTQISASEDHKESDNVIKKKVRTISLTKYNLVV